MAARFTAHQGQFLSFIYHYTKVNGQPPAEAEMGAYFRLTPPSVHSIVLRLEKLGLIARTAGQPRSIKVLVSEEELPALG